MISNYPSLFTHKGTPIRVKFFSKKKLILLIEPLKFSAGGIILQPDKIKKNGIKKLSLAKGFFYLLGHDGTIKHKIKAPQDLNITDIQSTVIYPDGTVWEGSLSKAATENPIALIWSTELSYFLEDKGLTNSFSKNHWTEVPTIVTITTKGTKGSCYRIEHTCPDCDKLSKSKS